MTDTKKYDVFLSYAQEDKAWAKEFAATLSEAGVRAWVDDREMAPGQDLRRQVQKALRDSATLVLIASPGNIDQPGTFFHVGAALADQKKIIAVLAHGADTETIKRSNMLHHMQVLEEESPTKAGKQVAMAVVKVTA